jgi:hypothetical protein
MPVASQPKKLRTQFLQGFGLPQHLTAMIEHLVTSKDEPVGHTFCNLSGFHLRQCVGDIARSRTLGHKARAHCLLVNTGRKLLDRDSRGRQKRAPCL